MAAAAFCLGAPTTATSRTAHREEDDAGVYLLLGWRRLPLPHVAGGAMWRMLPSSRCRCMSGCAAPPPVAGKRLASYGHAGQHIIGICDGDVRRRRPDPRDSTSSPLRASSPRARFLLDLAAWRRAGVLYISCTISMSYHEKA